MMYNERYVRSSLRKLGSHWELEDWWQKGSGNPIKSKALEINRDVGFNTIWYSDMILIDHGTVINSFRLFMSTNGYELTRKSRQTKNYLEQVKSFFGTHQGKNFKIKTAIFVELKNKNRHSDFDSQYFAIASSLIENNMAANIETFFLVLLPLTEKLKFSTTLSEDILGITKNKYIEIVKANLRTKNYFELFLSNGIETIITLTTEPVLELIQFINNKALTDEIEKKLTIGKKKIADFNLNKIEHTIGSGINTILDYKIILDGFEISLPYVATLKQYALRCLDVIVSCCKNLLQFVKQNELETKTLVGFVSGVWDGLVAILLGLIDFFILLLSTIIEMIKSSVDEAVSLIEEIVNTFVNIEWSKVWGYITGEFWDDLSTFFDAGFDKFLSQNATEMGYDIAYGAVTVLENFYKPL